jgi:hypothetical protein
VVWRACQKICRSVPWEVVLVLCKNRATGSVFESCPLLQTCEVRMGSDSYMCIEKRVAAMISIVINGDIP